MEGGFTRVLPELHVLVTCIRTNKANSDMDEICVLTAFVNVGR